jgi:hypothetical protein
MIDTGSKAIWEAILHVTKDRIQEAEKIGQKRKVERLQKVVNLLYDMPESER